MADKEKSYWISVKESEMDAIEDVLLFWAQTLHGEDANRPFDIVVAWHEKNRGVFIHERVHEEQSPESKG